MNITRNINVQKNLLAAEVCNLSECHVPLSINGYAWGSGSRTATSQYGARGWVVHHLSDIFGFTAPADGVWGVWPVGAAWLAQHPWEHYQFTGDRDFLRRRAWPLMQGAARFILDFLVEAPAGTPVAGKLVTCPSHSPENIFIKPDGTMSMFTYAATMDLEIIHDLLTHVIEAGRILDIEPGFRAECETALKRLAPLQISPKTGRLQEWIEDYEDDSPSPSYFAPVWAVSGASDLNDADPRVGGRCPEVASGAGRGGRRLEPGVADELLGTVSGRQPRLPDVVESVAAEHSLQPV